MITWPEGPREIIFPDAVIAGPSGCTVVPPTLNPAVGSPVKKTEAAWKNPGTYILPKWDESKGGFRGEVARESDFDLDIGEDTDECDDFVAELGGLDMAGGAEAGKGPGT